MSALVPRPAAAYCINPNFALLWGELPDPTTIPVYVSVGPTSSVEHTGLGAADIVRLTREIIARHNEADVGPTLVYMGLTGADMDYGPASIDARFRARPFGITIDSFTCAARAQHAPCGEHANVRACAKAAETWPKARISVVPFGCQANDQPHALDSNDLGVVLLHEIGHTLGLEHSQGSKAECEADDDHIHGNALAGNAGVMHAQIGGNFPALREWRRDDLDGLAALYGPPPLAELLVWDDAGFPARPSLADAIPLAGAIAHRPPAVSSAGAEQYIATVDAEQRVIVYTRTPSGVSEPEVVDPSVAGLTWGNPGLALGETALFVAWTAYERPDRSRVHLRFATRPLGASDWTLAQVEAEPNSRVKRLAAGHAAGVDVFLIASLTDYESRPRLVIIDDDGQLLGIHDDLGPPAFDVGNPACVAEDASSRCLIPFSTNEFAGPKLGWLELRIDEFGEPWLLDVRVGSSDATGKLGLARRSDAPGLRGAAGAQRYELGLDSDLALLELDGQGWPIAIGSAAVGGASRWWVYARHRAVCGDGLQQADEQCDDGDLDGGDGCGGTCRIEHELADAVAEDGETGEAALDCNCGSTPSSPLAAAFALLVLGFTRRSTARAGRCATPAVRASPGRCRGARDRSERAGA